MEIRGQRDSGVRATCRWPRNDLSARLMPFDPPPFDRNFDDYSHDVPMDGVDIDGQDIHPMHRTSTEIVTAYDDRESDVIVIDLAENDDDGNDFVVGIDLDRNDDNSSPKISPSIDIPSSIPDPPLGFCLPVSKSPIMDALCYCALVGWGVNVLVNRKPTGSTPGELIFRFVDFDRYYRISQRICSKQTPTEDVGARVKALRRFLDNFPVKSERTGSQFDAIVRPNYVSKLQSHLEENRTLLEDNRTLLEESSVLPGLI